MRPISVALPIVAVVRGVLCLIWFLSVTAKLSSVEQMSVVIHSILPFLGNSSIVLAVLMLMIEGTAFVLLLFRKSLNLGAMLSLVLGSIFIGVNTIRLTEAIRVYEELCGVL